MKNKTIKSILALVLSFAMLIPTLYTVFAETVKTPQITVSQVEGKAGETVKVEIALSNNPGIVSMTLRVDYDTEMLTMTKFTDAGLLGAQSHKPERTSPHTLVWVNDTATENITANGTVLTYEFKINENAPANAVYPIEVSYTPNNYEIYDKDLNQKDFDIVNGSVKVAFIPVNVTGVTFDKHALSMKTGESENLIATVSPENATDKGLIWESSNENVVTVDGGMVTAVKEGSATVTVTTADGNFTDSCEITVLCAHANKLEYAAVDSTCEFQGNKLYYVCDDCGEVFKADGVTVTTVADETLPLADHTYSYIGEEPATHFAPGMKEHYICDICLKLFNSDKQEITDRSELLITIIPHSYGDWQSNNISHWHECGCGNIIDKASHEFVWKTDKSATENETGIKHEECTVCGAVRSENTVIPKLEHTHAMTHYNAVEATCQAEGNAEYWHCTKCNKNYADESGTTELLTVAIPVNPDNHIGGTKIVGQKDADCETAGHTGDTICNGCGIVIVKGTEVSPLGHKVQSADWKTDSTNHWHECSVCGKKLDVSAHKGGTATCQAKSLCEVCGQPYGDFAEHKYIEKADAKYLKSVATCVSKAVYYKSCSVCGIKGTETFEYGEFDMNNHAGTTYIKDQKEATCYEEGYTGDTYCGDCNMKIEDGSVIAKAAHNPASVWSTDDNYHWKTCQTVGCGNIIDKAEHRGGTADCTHKAICEVCGVEYGATDVNNHTNTEIRNAVEATCTQDGYTGDIYCKDCGEKVADGTIIKAGHDYGDEYKSDAESHWKECVCGSIADKSAHAFGEWSVIKAATETEKGSKEKVCSVCEYKVTEDIPVISVEDNTANNEAENPTDKPETAVKPSDRVESPKTGAENDTVMYIVLLGISGFALIGTTIRRKKRVR